MENLKIESKYLNLYYKLGHLLNVRRLLFTDQIIKSS